MKDNSLKALRLMCLHNDRQVYMGINVGNITAAAQPFKVRHFPYERLDVCQQATTESSEAEGHG